MSGRNGIGKIWNHLLDLVYPPSLYCISCGKIIDDSRPYSLCNECMKTMNWITDVHCEKCGRPLSDNDPGGTCFSCARRDSAGKPYSFDKGYACAGYGTAERSAIFALKYGGRSDIGEILGEILYDRMVSEYGRGRLRAAYDIVLPVPTHRDKREKRGYDHADLMAESFAKRADIRYEADIIVRNRPTVPMKGLNPEERAANINGAFSIRKRGIESIRGASVLLVDDIFTTGSTVDEIAVLLKANGARNVDFIAFAAAGDMVAS